VTLAFSNSPLAFSNSPLAFSNSTLATRQKKILEKYGFKGHLLEWFTDFLRHRTQTVTLNHVRSNSSVVQSGVIQGSVVGPLLFNLFVDDLIPVVQYMDLYLFADDAKGLAKVDDVKEAELVQGDLDAIAAWSAANKLPLSLEKSCVIHYGSGNRRSTFDFNGHMLSEVEEHDDLGILRSTDFQYSRHVSNMATKVSRVCGMFCRAFVSRSREFMLRLWLSYLRPKLEYASQVWNGSIGVSKLEFIQRRFTKRIRGISSVSYGNRLQQLQLPSLEDRRLYLDRVFLHKLLTGKLNVNPSDLCINRVKLITRSHATSIVTYRPKSATIGRNFSFRAAKIWNLLPLILKTTCSSTVFKKSLQHQILR
jgi:hypothetical protein